MAAAVGDRPWRESAPEAVDRDLAALWREISNRGPVARAVMANLVVFRLNETGEPPPIGALQDDLLQDVVARHPSRTIVVRHDRGEHGPGRPVSAHVGISVFGPAAARYGVEWVVLRSACAEASFPSIVRRFARGDVPTSIWWSGDLSEARALEPIATAGRQLLYDSRQWRDVQAGLRLLTPILRSGRVELADINWRRLAPLRLGLVHGRAIANVTEAQARIVHRPGERALAALLSGWLIARPGWRADRSPTVVEEDLGGDVVRLELVDADRRLVARMSDQRVEIEQSGAAPLVIATPREATADGVAAELRALSPDRSLRDALVALADRLPS